MSKADKLFDIARDSLAEAASLDARSDECKWRAAEAMWQLNRGLPEDERKNHREIGDRVGCSAQTVSRYVRVWELRCNAGVTNFTDAYYDVQGHGREEIDDSTVARVLRDRPEVVAEKLAEQPEAARAIAEHPQSRQAVSRALDERSRNEEERLIGRAVEPESQPMRLSEALNVARGAVSALRFVASEVKSVDLADYPEAAEEIGGMVDEAMAFASMIRVYLDGGIVNDDELAALLGGASS